MEDPIQELATLEVPYLQAPAELQLDALGGWADGGALYGAGAEIGLGAGVQVGAGVDRESAAVEVGVGLLRRGRSALAVFAEGERGWDGALGGEAGATAALGLGPLVAMASGGGSLEDGAPTPWAGAALVWDGRGFAPFAEVRWAPDEGLATAGLRLHPIDDLELGLEATHAWTGGGLTLAARVVWELALAGGDDG